MSRMKKSRSLATMSNIAEGVLAAMKKLRPHGVDRNYSKLQSFERNANEMQSSQPYIGGRQAFRAAEVQ